MRSACRRSFRWRGTTPDGNGKCTCHDEGTRESTHHTRVHVVWRDGVGALAGVGAHWNDERELRGDMSSLHKRRPYRLTHISATPKEAQTPKVWRWDLSGGRTIHDSSRKATHVRPTVLSTCATTSACLKPIHSLVLNRQLHGLRLLGGYTQSAAGHGIQHSNVDVTFVHILPAKSVDWSARARALGTGCTYCLQSRRRWTCLGTAQGSHRHASEWTPLYERTKGSQMNEVRVCERWQWH